MGLSNLINNFTGSQTGGEKHIHDVMAWIESQGGVEGVIEKFRASGLGDIVASWIGKGDNLPVSVEQVISVFGEPALQMLSSKTEFDLQGVSSLLAKMLPGIVDHFSPDGAVQTNTDFLTASISLLKKKFFG